MRNLKISYLILLLIFSCQKDTNTTTKDAEQEKTLPVFLTEEHDHGELDFAKDFPDYYRDIVRAVERFDNRNSLFTIHDIDFTDYTLHEDSLRKVYTFLINSQWTDRFFNLRYEIQGDQISQYVLEIKPTSMIGFKGNELNFSGTISKILLENAFNGLKENIQNVSRCCDDDIVIIYCWKLIFENGKNTSIFRNPDGSGTGAGSEGGGSGGGGSDYEIEFYSCKCSPHHQYGETCNCNKGKPGWRIVKKHTFRGENISTSSRDWVECLRLLTNGGFITPDLGVGTTPTTSINCNSLAQNFITSYGLNMSVRQLSILVGGFGNSCGSQEDFDEYVAEKIIEATFGMCQPIFVNSTEFSPNEDCNSIITAYVPCSEIILTKKGNDYFSQIEIEQYIVTLCVPQPIDNEAADSKLGILKSANLKIEVQIPKDLIDNNIFSYNDIQSKLSVLFSEGLNYAAETVPLTNPCENLDLLRIKFRKAFFDYIQDPSVKANIFGGHAGSIQIYNRFIRVDITPSKILPVIYSSATDCN